MKIYFNLLITLLFFFSSNGFNQEFIKVGLFTSSKISLIELKGNEISYFVKADNYSFFIPENSEIQISSSTNRVNLSSGSFNLGVFQKIEIDIGNNQGVVLKPLKPNYPENKYTEKLLISSYQGKLTIVNKLTKENYVVGVLRGEIGFDKPFNSYLVMAILAQTYAEGYNSRHRSEGFNLCDQTHCQVFKGYFDYKPYHDAAYLSKNKIILDANRNIIEGLFHSNCGGITQKSGDVWKNNLNYCVSVIDSFCINERNSKWSKTFSLYDFYLKLNLPYEEDSAKHFDYCNNIVSINDNRQKEITINNRKINTVFMRAQLNLKSDWFDVKCQNDSIVINGRGFGHGVGLCQEGCIAMAKQGCNEEEIINFYFKDVIIEDKKKSNAIINLLK
jgi:stage II sporulation protein D